MSVRTTLYTGVTHKTVKKERRERRISPKSEFEITLDVDYDDYGHLLVDQNSFAASVMAQVLETDFHYFAMDDFRVRMPDIRIEVEGDVFERWPFKCHAYFYNPLPRRLTNGVFTIEGPGLGRPLRIPLDQ
jgi:annulin